MISGSLLECEHPLPYCLQKTSKSWELSCYLEQMTGGTLPVGGGSSCVVLRLNIQSFPPVSPSTIFPSHFFNSSSLTCSFKIYSAYFRFLKGQWSCILGDASQMFWFFPFDSCKSDGAQLSCPFLMSSKFLCDKLRLGITGRKEL